MCHWCCLVHLVNIASCTSLFAMELEKLLVNGKIYRFLSNKCPISIISNVTNNKTQLLKTVRLTKTTYCSPVQFSSTLFICASFCTYFTNYSFFSCFAQLFLFHSVWRQVPLFFNFEKLRDSSFSVKPVLIVWFWITFKPTNGCLYAMAFFSTWRSVLTSMTAADSVAKMATVEMMDCMAYGPTS